MMSDPRPPHEEYVPRGRAIWQSERANTYQCPTCQAPVFTQYEGAVLPSEIVCDGLKGHLVRWPAPDGEHLSRE
jgi:hypothetical protein